MASNYTDGITNVVINWDDIDGEYTAGQVLTGKIVVDVSETTKFKGVVLVLNGIMRIKWIEQENGSTIPYEEFSNLVHEYLEIYTPNLRDPNQRWIFPGKHSYEFKYKLPQKLPYSLDGSRFVKIFSSLTAKYF